MSVKLPKRGLYVIAPLSLRSVRRVELKKVGSSTYFLPFSSTGKDNFLALSRRSNASVVQSTCDAHLVLLSLPTRHCSDPPPNFQTPVTPNSSTNHWSITLSWCHMLHTYVSLTAMHPSFSYRLEKPFSPLILSAGKMKKIAAPLSLRPVINEVYYLLFHAVSNFCMQICIQQAFFQVTRACQKRHDDSGGEAWLAVASHMHSRNARIYNERHKHKGRSGVGRQHASRRCVAIAYLHDCRGYNGSGLAIGPVRVTD